MPTNDEERREVARKLRAVAERSRAWASLAESRDGAWYLRHLCAIAEASGTKYGGYEFEPDELCLRLAELVEPEPERTCKREKLYDAGGEWYEGCSKCRNPLSRYDVFCSKCGAKVVGE